MKIEKYKKEIGIATIGVIILIVTILWYKEDKIEVLNSSNIESIFIDESKESFEKYENNTDNNSVFKENSKDYEEINVKLESEKKQTIVVEIKGQVLKPNVYTLEEGSIVKDLIDLAGGLKEEADISNINRAKQLINHELVIINSINDVDDLNDKNMTQTNGNINNKEIININLADINQLKEIPGIGEVKAQSIIDYRDNNCGFKSIEEIMNVDGIGEKTFEKIKDKIIY